MERQMTDNNREHKGWPKGVPRSEETKKKISEALKGHKLSEEARRKISEKMKGRKLSDITKEKIAEFHKGTHLPEAIRAKISMAHKGKKLSIETRRRMSKAFKGRKGYWTGKHLSDKHKQKLHEAQIKYLEEHNVLPNVGKYEKQILDNLENELHYKILRQYKVGKYHLDGYIPELRLAIEVDEKYHRTKRQRIKDAKREQYIKEKLECEFLRLKIKKEGSD